MRIGEYLARTCFLLRWDEQKKPDLCDIAARVTAVVMFLFLTCLAFYPIVNQLINHRVLLQVGLLAAGTVLALLTVAHIALLFFQIKSYREGTPHYHPLLTAKKISPFPPTFPENRPLPVVKSKTAPLIEIAKKEIEKETETTIEALSNDTLSREIFFKYLLMPLSCMRVCKRWHRIIFEEGKKSLWKSIWNNHFPSNRKMDQSKKIDYKASCQQLFLKTRCREHLLGGRAEYRTLDRIAKPDSNIPVSSWELINSLLEQQRTIIRSAFSVHDYFILVSGEESSQSAQLEIWNLNEKKLFYKGTIAPFLSFRIFKWAFNERYLVCAVEETAFIFNFSTGEMRELAQLHRIDDLAIVDSVLYTSSLRTQRAWNLLTLESLYSDSTIHPPSQDSRFFASNPTSFGTEFYNTKSLEKSGENSIPYKWRDQTHTVSLDTHNLVLRDSNQANILSVPLLDSEKGSFLHLVHGSLVVFNPLKNHYIHVRNPLTLELETILSFDDLKTQQERGDALLSYRFLPSGKLVLVYFSTIHVLDFNSPVKKEAVFLLPCSPEKLEILAKP